MKALLTAGMAFLCVATSHAASGPASESWLPTEQVQGLMDSLRARPKASFGWSRPPDKAREGVPDFACGIFGSRCAIRRVEFRITAREFVPINLGFLALGPKGSGGAVDGPGKQGNGIFRVLKNEPTEMSMIVKSGFIDGTVTLRRDPVTGNDTMRYQGRLAKDDVWGPVEDKLTEIEVRYDVQTDAGSINWVEEGVEKVERFWGGGKGGKRMTIEFGGGWNHDFNRE